MLGVHRRLLAKRIQLWQGRISDHAVEQALVMYEMMLLAYLSAISCMILAGISSSAGVGKPVTATFVVLTFAIPAVLFAIALRCALAAGRDVVQRYGLPASSDRKARLKSPREFDRWIAKQPATRRQP
jgi:ABC-type microcin C transport system permease subunit YejB